MRFLKETINGRIVCENHHHHRLLSTITTLLNAGAVTSHSSSYTGVNWHQGRKEWRARGKLDGKDVCLGSHDTERKAALAYVRKCHEPLQPFFLFLTSYFQNRFPSPQKNTNAPLHLALPKDNWAKDIPGRILNLPDEQKPRKISDLRTEVLILYFQLYTPLHSPSVEQPQIVLSQLHLETHLLPYASPFFIVQKGFPKIAEEVLRVEGRFARAGFRK